MPVSSLACSSATRTASPVPRALSCTATRAPSVRSSRAGSVSRESTTSGRAPTASTVSSTCAMRGRPAIEWRTFGVFERIRVERPAASTMASGASVMPGRQAGAPGFEPGIADPKSAALPLGHAPEDTAQRIRATGLRPPRASGRLFASLDELRDAPAALTSELRVPLATELRLPGFAALATELRVTARAELRLPGLAALASELRVALGPELPLTSLAPTPADLAIEGRSMLARGRAAAPLTRLPDGELSSRIHASNVTGQPSLACHRRGSERKRMRAESDPPEAPGDPERVRPVVGEREERRAASGKGERDANRGGRLPRSSDRRRDFFRRGNEVVAKMG